jgi:hypothetical protein
MSNEGTNQNAAEAAKKAEEAIHKAEALEKTAREATSAAAQAREEAEGAKELAKNLSKKKKDRAEEAATSAKKAKNLSQNGQVVDKKFVLSYLQKNAFDLRRQIKNVCDIRFEDDPPRVIIEVLPSPSGINVKAPELNYNGVKLDVEMKIKKPVSVMVGKDEDEKNTIIKEGEQEQSEDETYHRSITGKSAEVLGITEALGPHSLDKAPKQREAYEAWLKRHPSIKVR